MAMKSKKRTNKAVAGRIHSPLMSLGATVLVALPLTALAQSQGFGDTKDEMCGFLKNITGLLNIGSIAVVTIAIIFAGYQIAFAHKRISEVAPILIGSLLIGAAGQIATMVIGDGGDTCDLAFQAGRSLLPYV